MAASTVSVKSATIARLGCPDVVHAGIVPHRRRSRAMMGARATKREPRGGTACRHDDRVRSGRGRPSGGGQARRLSPALAACVLGVGALARPGAARRRPTSSARAAPRASRSGDLALQIFLILSLVLVTVWVAARDRDRPLSAGAPRRRRPQTRGNLKIEIVWTLIPTVIVVVLFILTVRTTQEHRAARHRRAVHRHRPPVVVGVRLPGRGLRHRQRGPRAASAVRCRPTSCRRTSSTPSGCRRWGARST